MKNTNGNLPAMPCGVLQDGHNCGEYPLNVGMTKREMFCLHNGVADTGDAELDEIIRKGNYQKAAMAAMQGFCSDPIVNYGDIAKYSVETASAALAELERTNATPQP